MAKVTFPDGTVVTVEAPDTATDEQVYQLALAQKDGKPAGEVAPKPSFLQALGGAAKERFSEIGQLPGDMVQTVKNVGSALGDRNLPLRLSSATVPGAGPLVQSGMNLGTEGLAQIKEGQFNPLALALAPLPAFLAGGARAKGAIPNFKARVNPDKFRAAQETAQGGLSQTMERAGQQAPPMPAELPPAARTLGQDVDEFAGKLGNQPATDAAYQGARAAIPGGSGTRVQMSNLQKAIKELETHVVPKEPGPGTLQPIADEISRLKEAIEGLRPTTTSTATVQSPSRLLDASGKPTTVPQQVTRSAPTPGTEGTMPVGDAIKELRELGIRLKNRSDELGNLSKGHLAFIWKSLHADVEAAAAAGVPGAAEALKAAGALKGELAGESVSRIARGATRDGAVDAEAMARGVRGKEEPLGRLMGDDQVAGLQKLLERHRIESGVRAGATEANVAERAARTKAMDTTQGLPARATKPVQAGGETTQALDVGALETLLARNGPAVEKALGPGGVKMLKDFINANRNLPAKQEPIGLPSAWMGGLGFLAGVPGGGAGSTAGALAMGLAPPAWRGARSLGRAISSTPNSPDIELLMKALGQGGRALGQ